jgi:hypothetical protein
MCRKTETGEPMTDQQKQQAIAEWMGWTHIELFEGRLYGWPPGVINPRTIQLVPNFPRDLNEVHDAEAKLTNEQFTLYLWNLPGRQVGSTIFQRVRICATASKRSDALVKTIGKWVEEPDKRKDEE